MKNTAATKKEVSCKPLLSIFNYAKKKNVDFERILEGIPYDLSYLLNRHERIEWSVWCRLIANLKPYCAHADYEEMGRDYEKHEHYIQGYIFAFMFFSATKLATIAKRPLLEAGKAILAPLCSCLSPDWEVIGKNKVRVSIHLNPGYQHCPEWFYMSKGVWKELGNRVGLRGFKVDLSIISNGGVYIVSWDKEGFLAGLKKQVNWLFNVRRAFVDLNESHKELLNNYSTLEESKKLLQKQTTQLTTAYNIAKSIRQSFDINMTLNGITGALVNDAGLSCATIRIFRDVEGNTFQAEASNGIADMNVKGITHPILMNGEKIGELIIIPRIDADISELDELLHYLLPMINISIHDSLVLRTITDYKTNLETKVDERTAELKEAQEKLSEVIQIQKHFFANISHEFRTPLTLILGPVNQIMQATEVENIRNDLRVVHKNANRLLVLVNQLLDLSKLESGNMKLQTIRQNIIPLLKSLVLSFMPHAERKRITLTFNSTVNELPAYVDNDKIEKIITNLLSNAFKFTPEGGRIEIEVTNDEEYVNVRISDTGIGIPAEKIPRIFDRFYQVDGTHTREQEGTGIGLSLTKELVELHKGTIAVESTEGKGTAVVIRIPLGKGHLKPEEIYEPEEVDENTDIAGARASFLSEEMMYEGAAKAEKRERGMTPEAGKQLLLIVEDNAEMRSYISSSVTTEYRVLEAVDGEDGWNKSIELMPDVIISDVMMPGMDGFALCGRLKTDERTSHIPVILLTAKATSQDKIQGLATGADDYIMKPFVPEEVTARIRNLLEQRKRIHEHFRRHGLFEIEEQKITPVDLKFLQNAVAIITEQMADPAFGVGTLAAEMAISRSVLLKKIEGLVGEPPNELIKRTRLNKAAKLIESKFGNISEIALEVGFNSPSYFAECFKKQFGFSPSQYHGNSAEQ